MGSDVARLSQGAYFAGIERYLPLLHPGFASLLDYLPENVLLILDEPSQLRSHAEREREVVDASLRSRFERGEIVLVDSAPSSNNAEIDRLLEAATDARQTLLLALLDRGLPWLAAQTYLKTEGAPAARFSGKPGPLAEALDTYVKNGARVAVVSAQAPRVRGVLAERGLAESPLEALISPISRSAETGAIALVNGVLRGGFRLPDARLIVLSDPEIFGDAYDDARTKKLGKRQFREGMRLTSLLDIKPGDYVVHIHHGIGQYLGLTRRSVPAGVGLAPIEREYLQVAYEGNDKLYVPVDQLDRVQKYIGSDSASPPVHKLGSQEWLKATARAHKQAREIAGELIVLYAARQSLPGHAYAPDSPWVREMEDAFVYTETPDQLKAIEDVKRDLAEAAPYGPAYLRRCRAMARPRSPCARRSRSRARAGRSRFSARPPSWRPSTTKLLRAARRVPAANRPALPLPQPEAAGADPAGSEGRRRRYSHRDPPDSLQRRRVQRFRPGDRR